MASERPTDLLGLYVEAVRRMGDLRKKRATAAIAEAEAAAAREQLEGFKRSRSAPAETSSGAAGSGASGDDGEGTQLAKLLASIEAQGAECWRLEASVVEHKRQRLAHLRRERAATRGGMAEEADSHLFDAVPARLRRLLVPAGPAQMTAQHEAAEKAATCCAVTLALEAAMQEWMRSWYAQHLLLQGEAAAPQPAAVSQLLYGTTSAQMDAKLEAVRHCAAAAGLQSAEAMAAVARWLLRALPECVAVPCGEAPPDEHTRYRLPNGNGLEVVSEVKDEKLQIFDGEVMVAGEHDGETSGASYEPGPWKWDAADRVWRRDVHPHDVLVQVLPGCGHCYSEEFWRLKLSTTIDQAARGHGWRARKARCCAPMADGSACGAVLLQTRGLRVTRCNPPHAAELQAADAATRIAPQRTVEHVRVHGYWGSRIEQAVRLLLRLREEATAGRDEAAAKAVVYTRIDTTARLLQAACVMNGVTCAVPSGGGAEAQQQIAAFKEQPQLQVLLLSAQRDASGLTLTCARHCIILEPQPDLATELQMIGRVHRIGQTRQTYVHRLCVDGSFERSLATERQARAAVNGNLDD